MIYIKSFLSGHFQSGVGFEFSASQQIANRNISVKWALARKTEIKSISYGGITVNGIDAAV